MPYEEDKIQELVDKKRAEQKIRGLVEIIQTCCGMSHDHEIKEVLGTDAYAYGWEMRNK